MSIPIPPTNYDDEPTVCIRINELWIPVVLGALQKFLNPPQWGIDKNSGVFMINAPPIWEGDEEDQFLAEQQILGIMTALMLGNCEDDMPTGGVQMYAGTVAPDGWLLCDGSSHEKAVYPSLWGVLSLSGAIFEEDTDHFIVPDLRGRVVVGAGTGMGLTARLMGQIDGEETHLLAESELPGHTHEISASDSGIGGGGLAAATAELPEEGLLYTKPTGGDEPHNNMPPFFVLNFIIKT